MEPIQPIVLITPFTNDKVFCYLILDEPLTLIDTGPDLPECWKRLGIALKARGLHITDIERILLTHGHVDHAGMAGRIQAESSAEVFIHPADAIMLSSSWPVMFGRRFGALLRQSGFDKSYADELNTIVTETFTCATEPKNWQPMSNGQEFSSERLTLKALHTPGHSPGSVVFVDEKHKMLVTGDTLQWEQPPDTIISWPESQNGVPYCGMEDYLVSLDKMLGLNIERCYPGHGSCFDAYRQAILRAKRHFSIRGAKVRKLLENSELSPAEITYALTRETGPMDIFLNFCEVTGHLAVSG